MAKVFVALRSRLADTFSRFLRLDFCLYRTRLKRCFFEAVAFPVEEISALPLPTASCEPQERKTAECYQMISNRILTKFAIRVEADRYESGGLKVMKEGVMHGPGASPVASHHHVDADREAGSSGSVMRNTSGKICRRTSWPEGCDLACSNPVVTISVPQGMKKQSVRRDSRGLQP